MVHLFAMIRRRFMRAGRDPDAPAPIPLSISDLSPWSDEPQGDGISHLPSHTSPVEVAPHQSWEADTGGRPTPRDEPPGRTRFGNRSPGTRPRRDTRGPPAEPTGDPRPRAAARAFDALASRAHTVKQMRTRLTRAGFEDDVVTDTVARLLELGYLNDGTYADAWVATRREHRLHGEVRLRHDLAQRGVAPETITLAVVDDGEELTRARAAIERRVGSLAGLDREAFSRRLGSFLARRGFRASIVTAVVRDAYASSVDDRDPPGISGDELDPGTDSE